MSGFHLYSLSKLLVLFDLCIMQHIYNHHTSKCPIVTKMLSLYAYVKIPDISAGFNSSMYHFESEKSCF